MQVGVGRLNTLFTPDTLKWKLKIFRMVRVSDFPLDDLLRIKYISTN